jgi:hypothetical protein
VLSTRLQGPAVGSDGPGAGLHNLRYPAQVCVTQSSCDGVELPGSTDSERSRRAINLMSVAKFDTKVFVRSVDVSRADWQILFVTSGVNTDARKEVAFRASAGHGNVRDG